MLIDNLFLEFMHGLQIAAGPIITPFFHFITMLGEKGWFFILASLILCLRKKTRWVGVTAILAIFVGWVLADIAIKPAIARVRPYLSASNAFYQYWLAAGAFEETNYSMPSGHVLATSAFFFSLLLTMKRNYRKPIAITGAIFIVLMSFSRMYHMHHYFTDCLVAILLGLVMAFISRLIVKFIHRVCKAYEDVPFFYFILNFDILGSTNG